MTKAREITSFVKKRNALVSRFRSIQEQLIREKELDKKLELVYVGATRLYTHHLCLLRIIQNKEALLRLV